MSGELAINYPSGSTLYAVARNEAKNVWYVVGEVFEAWGTSGRTAADYSIALTGDDGDIYVGDFDTNIIAGHYYLAAYLQTTGAPLDADSVVASGEIWWDGSTEQTQTEYELNAYAPATEAKQDIIDTNVDSVLSDIDKFDNMITEDSGGNYFTATALELAPTAEMDATEFATAMKAITGITEGGTMTWQTLMKINAAWVAGNWQLKSGETAVYELLDADDGATVIMEMTLSQTTPHRTISVQI